MKRNRLLLLATLPLLCLSVQAQDRGPQRNDFTVAATVSYNNSVMKNADVIRSSYSIAAESTNWNDKQLSVGIEGGWFFSDSWKLVLGGGVNVTRKPGYAAVPGTIDENTDWSHANDGSIPDYEAVSDESYLQFNVFTGVDRYFKTKVEGLYLYTGLRAGYAYGRNISYVDNELSMGKSVGESFNIRGALTGGVDYFITDGFYVGAQVDPFAYTYNRSLIKPQEGLSNLDADSHNFGILAAPTLKVGFKF